MKQILAVILAILPVLYIGCSKKQEVKEDPRFSDQRVVLQVGDNKLTLGDVNKRFATAKFQSAQQEYDMKKGFVEQFLQRFLLIEGAKEQGITAEVDTSMVRRSLLQNLYNDKILSKINVTDSDVSDFFQKYGGEVEVGQIALYDSLLADSLYNVLTKGGDFEQLAREYSKDEISAAKGGILGYTAYGRLPDKIQDAAFSMKIGEFSKPIRTRSNWLIVKVYDRIKNTPADLQNGMDNYRNLTNQYTQKREVNRYVDEARSEVHYRLVDATIKMMIGKADSIKAAGSKPANLPSSAYLDSAAFNGDQLKMYMAEYDGGGTTVRDYLVLMKGYAPERAPEMRDTGILDDVLEGMTMPSILEKIAKKEGIDQTKTFKDGMDYLKGNILAQKMTEKIYQSMGDIPDSTIARVYKENPDKYYRPDQMRAAGIASKTQQEAEDLLRRARSGENFYRLAKQYSIDKTSAEQNGDLGFFTAERNTPIYKAGENMKKGDMGGPVQMDNNWWVFMVTDRIARSLKPLKTVEPEIIGQVSQEWRTKALNNYLAGMKEKSHYTMDLDLVRGNLFTGSLSQATNDTTRKDIK